jgi:hypothetical protein
LRRCRSIETGATFSGFGEPAICASPKGRSVSAASFRCLRELTALCEDQTLPLPRAAAAMFNGWVMAHSGKISEGILLAEQALSDWHSFSRSA